MNKKPQRMPVEQDFIPYQPASLPGDARVLALAPHPDDEVLGCGGLLTLHAEKGDPVDIMILTDGCGFSQPGTDKSVFRLQRERESIRASEVLGYPAPQFLRLPDRGLTKQLELPDVIEQRIKDLSITHLVCPSPSEIHPDHFATAMFGLEVARRCPGIEIVFYEVGVPMQPNFLLDVTGVWERKQRAIDCFQTQLALQSYDRHCAGLSAFRSYTLARDVRQIEAFRCLRGAELKNWFTVFGRSRFADIVTKCAAKNVTDTDVLRPISMLKPQ